MRECWRWTAVPSRWSTPTGSPPCTSGCHAAEDLTDTADVFGLLADPNRLRLLVALLDGELCVCDLAAVTGQSESAVSHALRLLRAHRIVAARRAYRMAYYRLEDPHVRMLLDLALAHTEHTEALHPEREGTT